MSRCRPKRFGFIASTSRRSGKACQALGLCSNAITKEQVGKVANWAHRLTEGRVVVLDDCEPERERQSKDLVFALAEQCSVRRGWSPSSHEGRFKGRQPESLTREEWEEMIRPALLGQV